LISGLELLRNAINSFLQQVIFCKLPMIFDPCVEQRLDKDMPGYPEDSLILFPKFPMEVRHNISDNTVGRPESVVVNVIDNSGGGCVSPTGPYPSYNIMAANTEAFNNHLKGVWLCSYLQGRDTLLLIQD
jgi:hypothetical protein